LMQELRSIEEALSKAEEDGGPTKLKLNVKFDTSKDLELVVNTSGATIRTVAIFAEQIFSEESFVVFEFKLKNPIITFRHPKISQEELRIPLKIEKHIATDLFIKSVIGNKAR
jgi:hypothetical protein